MTLRAGTVKDVIDRAADAAIAGSRAGHRGAPQGRDRSDERRHHSGRRQWRRADAGCLQAQARDLRRTPARRHRARVQAHGPGAGRQGLSGPGRGLHRALQADRRTSAGARPRSSTCVEPARWRCGWRRFPARGCWCRSASRCRRRSGSACCRRPTSSRSRARPQAAQPTPVSAKTQYSRRAVRRSTSSFFASRISAAAGTAAPRTRT